MKKENNKNKIKFNFGLNLIFAWFLIDEIKLSLSWFNYENKKINYVKEMIGSNMFEIELIQVKLAGGIRFYHFYGSLKVLSISDPEI